MQIINLHVQYLKRSIAKAFPPASPTQFSTHS